MAFHNKLRFSYKEQLERDASSYMTACTDISTMQSTDAVQTV